MAKPKTTKLPLASLVLDWAVYPRTQLDEQHSIYMADALKSGVTMPPIIADAATKRIVDGFHRHRAYKRFMPAEALVDVELRAYANESELFLDAMRLNSAHGARLTPFDRTHCVLIARKLAIAEEALADALQMTIDTIRKRAGRIGKHMAVSPTGETIEEDLPLKRSVRHMRDKLLSEAQWAANDRLSGMDQTFHVNQLILLLENDLADLANENFIDGLRRLLPLITDTLADIDRDKAA